MTHPAVYALTAGVAIGCFIFYFVTSSFREKEQPYGHNQSKRDEFSYFRAEQERQSLPSKRPDKNESRSAQSREPNPTKKCDTNTSNNLGDLEDDCDK